MNGAIGAVVLAGGRSSRFGGDKLAEPIDGRPMLDHAIEAVRTVAVDIVVVVAPDADLAVPAGTRIVHDERAFEGPLVGLATGLAALDPGTDRAIVVAGDMPDLVPAVLAHLIQALALAPQAAVALGQAGQPQPLPMAVVRAPAERTATELIEAGERRLRAFVTALEAVIIPEPMWRADDPAAATLRDIDTRADLADRDSTD